MKRTLLQKVEQLRTFAMLLVLVLSAASASAALESDDINAAILADSSIPVKWTDDATHPWILTDSNVLSVPSTTGDYTTSIVMEYSSDYPTKLSFDYRHDYYYSSDRGKIIIDGSEQDLPAYSSWRGFLTYLSAGTHKIEFLYTSTEYKNPDDYYLELNNVRVWECKELETQVLKSGSLPLTFQNDSENPWIAEEGYIYSNPNLENNATSSFSTSFVLEKTALFSYEQRLYSGSSEMNIKVIIDGIEFRTHRDTDWSYNSVVLYPGSHTIEFKFATPYSGYQASFRNISLDQTWYDVTLSQPGTLAARILQALGDKNLQDAELVKISGSMNEDDWATVKQLTGIKALDLTGVIITEIPDNACQNLRHLSTVMLPSSLKEIGHYAFSGTNFHQITIPASVESIGYQVWADTPLQFIKFEDNSNLWRIGYRAFYNTNLIELDLPDSVTFAGRYSGNSNTYWPESWPSSYGDWDLVANCKSLKRLHLPEGMHSVPNGTAYQCVSLEEVNIPKNATYIDKYAFYNTYISSIELPESLRSIMEYAFSYSDLESVTIPKDVSEFGEFTFSYCKNLKTVVLNSHPWKMNRNFYDCTALETVVLPCPTPPSIDYNPFYDVDRSKVTLIVPDFAVDSYRADPYWYNFTNTQAGNEASLQDYWAIRGNLTLDSSHQIQGNPSVELMSGGVLSMDNGASQNFKDFIYNTQESTPASYLSESNSVRAESLNMNFYVEKANTWYFFSPVCDVKMSDVSFPATESWVIRYYDGAKRAANNDNSGNWVDVPADGSLLRGQGYIIQANAAGWLQMKPESAEHDKFFGANEVTLPLEDHACETAVNAGWNFVANPYPSYYDIYYLDLQAPITVWTGSTYRAYSLNDGDRGDDTFVLRPMQPFFVQKASTDLTTGFPTMGRRNSTVIDRTRSTRSEADPSRQIINLEMLAANNTSADDYTRVVLNEKASTAYEVNCDASKFMSLDSKVAQIYTLGNDKEAMSINERPYANGLVLLGVYTPVNGATYRIGAPRIDHKAWLHDAETGIEHDLTAGEYVFTSSKSGVDNSRFSIRFAESGTTGIEETTESSVKVMGNVGSISVNALAGSTVIVFATDGSVIASVTADSSVIDINVPTGLYVVKVNDKSFKTIVK